MFFDRGRISQYLIDSQEARSRRQLWFSEEVIRKKEEENRDWSKLEHPFILFQTHSRRKSWGISMTPFSLGVIEPHSPDLWIRRAQ